MSERQEMTEEQKREWEKYVEKGSGNLLVDYFQKKIKDDKKEKEI